MAVTASFSLLFFITAMSPNGFTPVVTNPETSDADDHEPICLQYFRLAPTLPVSPFSKCDRDCGQFFCIYQHVVTPLHWKSCLLFDCIHVNMQLMYDTLLSVYLLVSVIVDFMLIWFYVAVIILIVFFVFFFFSLCSFGSCNFLSAVLLFYGIECSSMGLFSSGNREINMMMMMSVLFNCIPNLNPDPYSNEPTLWRSLAMAGRYPAQYRNYA